MIRAGSYVALLSEIIASLAPSLWEFSDLVVKVHSPLFDITILFIYKDAFGSVKDCFLQLDKTSGMYMLPERVDPNGTSP